MSLANLVVPEDHHEVGGQRIRLTGLSMEAIVMLLQEDKGIMEVMMDTGITTGKLVEIAPNFVAKMIAHSAGEPSMVDKVKTIPFGDQVQMVNKVWTLTNIDMDAVGKVMELLADTIAGAAAARASGAESPTTGVARPTSSSRRAE